MGKLAIKSRTSGPTKEELYGRVLEGLADTDIDRFNAYKRAMGADNVKLENYVEQSPDINVQRRGKWVEPDKGIDVYDFTTDMVPELPAIGGAAIGGATAGIQGAVGGATIGNLIKQKIAQKMGLRKGINEGEAKLEGAMELLGPIGAAIPTPNVMARTVFHGSPHVFDKFDMSKIGTGEGAQAYGHGLYFAESPDVAGSYKKVLSSGNAIAPTPANAVEKDILEVAAYRAQQIGGDITQGLRHLADNTADPARVKAINRLIERTQKHGGAMYTVDIPDEHIDRMLDWDKPLSEQSEYVKTAVAKALQSDNPSIREAAEIFASSKPGTMGHTADFFYRGLQEASGEKQLRAASNALLDKYGADQIGSSAAVRNMTPEDGAQFSRIAEQMGKSNKQRAASDWLRDSGIPGIKYLDGTSRTAGAGTQNFVVFDDSIPKILGRE